MAELVPAIPVFLFVRVKDVDARHKAGHECVREVAMSA